MNNTAFIIFPTSDLYQLKIYSIISANTKYFQDIVLKQILIEFQNSGAF